MATIRKFCCNDLLRFASVNLDHLTITAKMSNYLNYFIKWSDYCHVAVAPGNRIMGYIVGVVEDDGQDELWQGLSMAVNVHPEYRRQKLATKLMRLFEKQLVEKMLSTECDREYFVCLYVSVSNNPAINMFEELGYEVSEIMPEFYPNKEDAYEMRKALVEEQEDFNLTIDELFAEEMMYN